MKKSEIKIPEVTIKRLSIYLRCLKRLEDNGESVVSSQRLGDMCCLNPTQIRKDLSYFGEFGKRGVGYNIKKLQDDIREVLGLNKEWKVILVGAGNLGKALLHYPSFETDGYNWVAVYDISDEVIGTEIKENLIVKDYKSLTKEEINKLSPDFAVITTPASVAQEVVDRLIDFGIKGFLNFAPVKIKVPYNIVLKNVFIIAEFDNLAYALSSGEKEE